MIALLGFAAAQAASVLGARALLRPLASGDADLDLLQLLLLRLLLISATILAAGLLGVLDSLSLGLAGGVALIGLVLAGAHKGLRRPALPDANPWVLALAAALALRLLLQVWFFAPHLGDAVAYHLPKIGEWVRHGAFTREMGLHPHVTFPAGFELVETWWVVFLRHDVLIEAAGVEFVALAAVAVRVLAKRVGLDERAATLAALVYVLSPGFHLSATSCLNDAPAAAMVLCVFALAAARAPWGLVLAAAALGVGIKPTVGFALPGALFLIPGEERRRSKAAWLVASAAAVVGAFWYARNLLWFGNPVYPLGSDVANPVAVQLGPRLGSLGANLRELLGGRLLDGAAASGANVDHGAGWGAAALVGLAGLIPLLRDEPRSRRMSIAFAVALLGTLLFTQSDPWSMKYAFFFPALPAIAAAAWAARSRGAAALTSAGLALAFAATLLPYDLPWRSLKVLAAHPVSTRSALPLWADDAPEDVVGAAGGFTVRSYLLYRPDFSREVIYGAGPRHVFGDSPGPDYESAGRNVWRRKGDK